MRFEQVVVIVYAVLGVTAVLQFLVGRFVIGRPWSEERYSDNNYGSSPTIPFSPNRPLAMVRMFVHLPFIAFSIPVVLLFGSIGWGVSMFLGLSALGLLPGMLVGVYVLMKVRSLVSLPPSMGVGHMIRLRPEKFLFAISSGLFLGVSVGAIVGFLVGFIVPIQGVLFLSIPLCIYLAVVSVFTAMDWYVACNMQDELVSASEDE